MWEKRVQQYFHPVSPTTNTHTHTHINTYTHTRPPSYIFHYVPQDFPRPRGSTPIAARVNWRLSSRQGRRGFGFTPLPTLRLLPTDLMARLRGGRKILSPCTKSQRVRSDGVSFNARPNGYPWNLRFYHTVSISTCLPHYEGPFLNLGTKNVNNNNNKEVHKINLLDDRTKCDFTDN